MFVTLTVAKLVKTWAQGGMSYKTTCSWALWALEIVHYNSHTGYVTMSYPT